jgi:hypothetical protein
MSYDIELKCPVTKKTIVFDFTHQIRGGTYAIHGNNKAELNITYNYAPIFYKLFPKEGIRTLYGMTGAESIPVLMKAIDKLKDDVSDNYWECTEGNVKISLNQLLTFAKLRLDGIWSGD